MCLIAPHLFVCIGENFVSARKQANCADEAQDRDFRSICGDFDLEASLSAATWRGSHDLPGWHSIDTRRGRVIRQRQCKQGELRELF